MALKSQRVKLSIGSDCHSAHYETDFDRAATMLDAVQIKDGDLSKLPPEGQITRRGTRKEGRYVDFMNREE